MSHRLSAEQLERVRTLVPSIGVTATASEMGVRFSRVKSAALELGISVVRGRKPSPKKAERNRFIRRDRAHGMTLDVLSNKYRVTTQRISQILAETGGDPYGGKPLHIHGAKPTESIETKAVVPTPEMAAS